MPRHYSADDCEHDEAKARDADGAPKVIEKGGGVFPYRRSGQGHLLRLCIGPCCILKDRYERYKLLPCLCHGLIHECTCRVREKHCQTCRKTYLQVEKAWYEIDDPHAHAEGRT